MPAKKSSARSRVARFSIFLLLLIPFIVLLYQVQSGSAGANPVETVQKQTGEWGLRMLWLTLMMSPLTRLMKSPVPVSYRRMIGLYSLFYATLHFLAYLVLDLQLDLVGLWQDLIKRPYMTIGFVAFTILVILGVTSTHKSKRKLGPRWVRLHRWVYIAALATVVHYLWLVKGEQVEPVIYLVLLGLLLTWRLGGLMKSSK